MIPPGIEMGLDHHHSFLFGSFSFVNGCEYVDNFCQLVKELCREEASSRKGRRRARLPLGLKDRPEAWDDVGIRNSPDSRLGRLGEPVFARKGFIR
jgi:hypothetical protein